MNLWFTWTSSVICFLQTKANALLFCNLFAELPHFFPFRQRREQSLAIKNAKKKAASLMWAEVLTASSLNDSFLIYILKEIKCVYISFVFFTICLLINQSKNDDDERMTSLFCALKNTLFGKPISKAHDSRRYHFKRVCLCVQQIMIRIQKYRQ